MALVDRTVRFLSILSVPLLTGLLALAGCGGSSTDSPGSGGSGTGGVDAGTGGTGTGGSSGGSGGGGGSAGSSVGGAGGATAVKCFPDLAGPIVYINYDQFKPVINSTCTGTNHQDIQGVQRLVFLGDSITKGTPPTTTAQFYRTLVTNNMEKKFGIAASDVQDCSKWGARNGDLAGQIQQCFPTTPEQKKTLTVFTMGGNDLADMAGKHEDVQTATAQADQAIADLRSAVEWLKDPKNFPNGSYVVFADVYEYTDLSANLDSCPLASTAGLSGTWQTGVAILTHMDEQYMKVAVDTQSDMIFMEETFCGHGYEASDSSLQCYHGPNTQNWFDLTCIHPTPKGHSVIADLFTKTINE